MMSLASLEYSQLSHFQKLALLLVIGPHNLPDNVRVPFSIRLPFQMIEKNNDNSVVQSRGSEGGHNAHLVRRQRLPWQSIRKHDLDNTLHEPQPTLGNQRNHRWKRVHVPTQEHLQHSSDNRTEQHIHVHTNRMTR